MQGFQIIRCLIKPSLKNIQTIFQGGTSWVAQLLNNINVWMVPYCGQQLLGLKKSKNLRHLSLSKAGPFTLESHVCVNDLKCKVFQIIRCLIKPLLKNEWMCNTAREIEAATQPLSHSARVAGPATQPLWQSGWTSHSYQSVWVADGWVAEWLRQSGCSSHSGRMSQLANGV